MIALITRALSRRESGRTNVGFGKVGDDVALGGRQTGLRQAREERSSTAFYESIKDFDRYLGSSILRQRRL